jgi:hypothetical protein
MKSNFVGIGIADITLSRRNLLTLLAKLDAHPADSALTISRYDGSNTIIVHAEEDADHYDGRKAGRVDEQTEAVIADKMDPKVAIADTAGWPRIVGIIQFEPEAELQRQQREGGQ